MKTEFARHVFLAALLATPFASPALAAPMCIANGESFPVGETTCLTITGTSHLARCDMVLNITSWTKIEDTCPADSSGAPDKAAPDPNIAAPTAN